MMWGGYGFGWMGAVMSVSAVLWWVLVIAVVLAVVRWLRTPDRGGADGGGTDGGGTAPAADPRQILDVRFARGVFAAVVYAHRRLLLTGS
jgi:hypothetical protein